MTEKGGRHPYGKLFTPIRIGYIDIKNRVAMAPIANTGIATVDGCPTDYYIAFLEARARGGVGLIITANTEVDPEQRMGIGLCAAKMVSAYARLVEALHIHGARIFLQIAHRGGCADSKVTGRQAMAPSAISCKLYPGIPREVSDSEIRRLIDQFVQAARWGQQAHFDGVELHAAHGHDLIEHFISPHTNRRTGRYGGSFEARMRLPVEILNGIKETCGSNFPVGFKFSAYEHLENGIDLPLAKRIASHMEDAGIDYLHVATTVWGLGGHEYLSLAPLYSKRRDVIELAKGVKSTVRCIPVIGATNIGTPEHAERVLSRDGLDMVALGRALLADPNWVQKAKWKRASEIQPCIRCNECHLQMAQGKLWRCTVNPYLRWRGGQDEVLLVKERKRIAVVGAGPAGMQAALTAAMRGHKVHLYEQSDQVGGNLVVASVPPFKNDLERLLNYYQTQVERSRIALHLETEIGSTGEVTEINPDAVILAVGAEHVIPDIPGIDGENVATATEILQRKRESGEEILVVGSGVVGAEVAWHLALQGKSVQLVDCLGDEEILAGEHANNRNVLLWNLGELGVPILANRTVQRIAEGEVWLLGEGGQEEMFAVDSVVLAVGFQPRTRLGNLLREEIPDCPIIEIGDCLRPGKLVDAIHMGHLAAEAI